MLPLASHCLHFGTLGKNELTQVQRIRKGGIILWWFLCSPSVCSIYCYWWSRYISRSFVCVCVCVCLSVWRKLSNEMNFDLDNIF